jgi:hypothetical protein
MTRAASVFLLVMVATFATHAVGQPGAAPAPSARSVPSAPASAAPSAAPSAAGSAISSGSLPPGHPPTDTDSAGDMPPGHPGAGDMPPGHSSGRGIFQPPADQVTPSDALPRGSLAITIADSEGKGVADAAFVLIVHRSSVSKGDSTERIERVTDGEGRFRFDKLEIGSGIGYRVLARRGEALYSTEEFGLRDTGGMTVLLHVYDGSSDLATVPLVIETTIAIDIGDDSFVVQNLVRTLNLGRIAFVGDIELPLPEGYKAFQSQAQESEDVSEFGPAVVEREGSARLIGTYPPGQTEVLYSYQIPLEGSEVQELTLPVPPRSVSTGLMVSSGPTMSLRVNGFPEAEPGRRRDGRRVLQTGKQADLQMGLQAIMAQNSAQTVTVVIGGIPTPGPWRWLAGAIAFLSIVSGGYYLVTMRKEAKRGLTADQRADLLDGQRALLEEIAALERARASGEVGPQSYERLRAALLDALARIVSSLENDGRDPRQGVSEPPVTTAAAATRGTTEPARAARASEASAPAKASAIKRRRKRDAKRVAR